MRNDARRTLGPVPVRSLLEEKSAQSLGWSQFSIQYRLALCFCDGYGVQVGVWLYRKVNFMFLLIRR